MQTQLELEAISVRLYKYLCEEVVGSENIVRYRRLYYKLHDDLSYDNNFEYVSSGSKAEGLDFPTSDFDWMILWKIWQVYDDTPKEKEDVLFLDTENALPGFALLKKSDNSSFPCSPIKTDFGNLISNRDFLHFGISAMKIQSTKSLEINGPCISTSVLVDIDLMHCLKCNTWPTVAKQWLLRVRPSRWPSQDIVSKIVSDGCLLVPVGSKSTCKDGNPLEWRFSFSLGEKLLVHSFNHTQLLCYALLKIWLKEILDSDNILNKKLCSYFMKTALFWIIEEREDLNWRPKNLLHCFYLCIHRLHYWIVCGYFPNYFIPEHNMIDGKLSGDDLKHLSSFLEKNMRENLKLMFSVPSLGNFRNIPINIQRESYRLREFDMALLSLQTFGNLLLEALKECKADLSACIIYRMIHKHLPNSARKILILMFLKMNKNILATFHIVNSKNKRVYLRYKECLSRILINTFYDAEAGWLLLAAFFYSTQNYRTMSCILQLSSSMFSLEKRLVQNNINTKSFRDMSKLRKMVHSSSFIKRMRYENPRVFYEDFNSILTDNYPFLTEEIPKFGFYGLQPHSLFYFLKFLYGHKQGNSLEARSAVQLLNMSFEEDIDKSRNMLCLISSYMLLSTAFELLHDEEGHAICSLRFLKAIKMSKTLPVFMKHEQDEEFKMLLELV
ncbi:Hypothetical predicted protein [Mytilus galloprovincialis]|uniref:Mab-21-like HhH/H2TH-like domain-containing protein n=1 Tax=Mytilus galloprovincialis TaxID=29158 RepID=A0A8B6HQC2_MYTGA|nr:Hypothetical predicted protein [Mytilus galloprovincialis]